MSENWESQSIIHDFQFDYDEHARWVSTGWQMGRLEFIFKNQNFDPQTNLQLQIAQDEIIESIKPILSSKRIVLRVNEPNYRLMSLALNRDIELVSGRYFAFYLVGMAALRISMADRRPELLDLARSCVNSIPAQYLKSKDLFFDELVKNRFQDVVSLTDYLTSICESTKSSEDKLSQQETLRLLGNRAGLSVGGDLIIGGDKVGRDKSGRDKVEKYVGGDQVGRDKMEGITLTLPEAFSKLHESLSKVPECPEKNVGQTAIQQLEVEAKKGEQADEKKVERWFNALVDYLPDIGEIAVNTFLNPVSGLSTAFQKIAKVIKKRMSGS